MKIAAPCIITPRLLPGLHIGGAFVSIRYASRRGDENRTRYEWIVDLENQSFSGDDLQSGNSGGDLQDGLSSLLCFLGAAAEGASYERRTGRKSENSELFPAAVVEWADANSDEIGTAAYELEMNQEQDDEPYIIDEDESEDDE